MNEQYTFERNWERLLKEWTWYAAGTAILGPFILIAIIDPDWIARLIGITAVYTGLPAVLLWFALGPQKNLGSEGRTIWPKYITKRLGDKVYLGTRLLLVGLAGFALYLLTVPLVVDILAMMKGGGLLQGSGTVTSVDGSSVAGFISQTVAFDSENPSVPENRFHSAYFLIGSIKYGDTYEFVYLPHTRTILEMKQISE